MGIEHDTTASAAPAPAPVASSGSADNSKPPQTMQSAPDGSALPGAGGNESRGDRNPKNGRFDNKRGRGRGGRGGRGGGGGGRGGKDNKEGGDNKRRDLGRNEYGRKRTDKRGRNDDWQDTKRRKVGENGESVGEDGEPRESARDKPSYMSIPFAEEEIAAEERRPKRKVAVMIGYAGTGYHGMQINHREKTIEGDLFAAFVTAKAISKANADDPRKSQLIRCARTDKGVHAAGNVISLKLIIEDEDIVQKINEALPPQIRIWGIQRTNNAFNCYQTCDSRWYEYLMPSYCLLPPHHESFLGKKVLESVKENGVEEEYANKLGDLKDFWYEVEKNDIQPILESLEPEVREKVMRRLFTPEDDSPETKTEKTAKKDNNAAATSEAPVDNTEAATETLSDAAPTSTTTTEQADAEMKDAEASAPAPQEKATEEVKPPKEASPVDVAVKQIKAAYVAAKRRYRTTPGHIARLQEALNQYLGTRNYHNYTVQKAPSDPSAKRHIKSFIVNPQPIQINDTEWLSLKVHGQSFMMHQIRKMVGMAVLLTRCATDLSRIEESYQPGRISIPKAPGLGLLLERPVFENYNTRAAESYDRPKIDFGNYEKELQAFKDSHIYQRIFDLEEKENSFHAFFHQIDNFKTDYFLWVTAGGMGAAHKRIGQGEDVPEGLKKELGDDGKGGEIVEEQ
ncbi:tRNA pseudouridine synthase [Apiospora aurea]|uniref:tRNA pseudouridine synthase n=1 Tax=Apiospora aurea TaxID=335848 RepID=A0ABR1QQ80_9PEZI